LTASPFYDSKPVDLKSFTPTPEPKTAPKTAHRAETDTATAPKARSKPETAPRDRGSKADHSADLSADHNGAPHAPATRRASRSDGATDGVKFTDLGLERVLLDALAQEGYETPTPIQASCITPAIAGKDLLGCAQTGTGKTAAFALPVLHRLMTSTKRPARGPNSQKRPAKRLPRALVLSPTRELADQIAESFATYGAGTHLRHTVVYGGVKQFRQVKALQRGVDILVATPGRLLDLMEQGHIDLRAVEMFVLDEADRMLDMGFINPIRRIASSFAAKPQTLLFSATMPGPIARLADTLLTNPHKVEVTPVSSAVPLIDQSLYLLDGTHKPTLLTHLLDDPEVERAVVFIRTKHGAEKLAKLLGKAGVSAESIHGNKNQNQRTRALDSFRSGRSRVLVATDVAARGLDVDGITHVFNFNLPNEPEAYVHRIGRTGRAGQTGKAIAFCARDERGFLHAIERLTKTTIDESPLPDGLGIPDEPPLKRHAPRIGEGKPFPGRKGRRGTQARPGARPGASGGRSRRARPNTHGEHSAHGGTSGHQPAGGRGKRAKNKHRT
jgi:ATP-dependent RNA helicase RhlE